MAKTYISSSLAGAITNDFVNGISQSPKPFDIKNSIYEGLQVGTNFVAYPIAEKVLHRSSKKYRKSKNKNKVFMYTANALVTSAIVASVNYPIVVMQKSHNKEPYNISLKDFGIYFVDQILPNIGFPVANDYLEKVVPNSTNTMIQYLRNSGIAAIASLSGSVANLPLSMIKDHATISGTISDWFKSIGGITFTNDSFAHFSKVFGSITK
ncbi:hypothetical protein GPJ56_007405 [Histomonas meleagridis]|uniref:uncharacterized protein n=1 Tax=Histomonas meleagridis TaxID=135588 RepID=UPI003559A455|nr:hypothetical protein GPJ56_007405 [Histomonas meleagridis]KAH0804251.1 hypothetical protein GO595_003081 [Histomonas meleagridis]